MFTPESRTMLREELVAAAEADDRLVGAALTGSAATGREDAWSDIDLALSVAEGLDRDTVLSDWSERMYAEHGAVSHLDVYAGPAVYRVFLLADTLQVDISFWPAEEFTAIGPRFRLLFGEAKSRPASPPDPDGLVGMGWLYALHARSSLARGRVWQAEYMISAMRDQVFALACVRYGVPAREGRGMDDLPASVVPAETLVRSFAPDELARAFHAVTEWLLAETALVDGALAERLTGPLRELAQG